MAWLEGCSGTSRFLGNPSSGSVTFIDDAFQSRQTEQFSSATGCANPTHCPAPQAASLGWLLGHCDYKCLSWCRCHSHRAVRSLPAWLLLPVCLALAPCVLRPRGCRESRASLPLLWPAEELEHRDCEHGQRMGLPPSLCHLVDMRI